MTLSIVAMLLVVLSWLGWQAIYSSVLNYQSIAISQRTTQQFLLAEYALKQAEQWLQQTPYNQLPAPVTECIKTPCILIANAAHFLPQQPSAWWQIPNNYAVAAVTMEAIDEHQAFYAVERLTDATTPEEIFYRITTWALLTGESQATILQTIWKKSLPPTFPDQRYAWRRW